MDQRDEFSKWITAVESALSDEKTVVDEDLLEQGECGACGNWDCPECFPDTDGALDNHENSKTIIIVADPADFGLNGNTAEIGQEPDFDSEQQLGIGMAGAHPVSDDTYSHQTEDEIDVTTMGVDEETVDECDVDSNLSSDGSGVKLGDIVQKFVPVDKSGINSPFSHGSELEEGDYDSELDFEDPVPYSDAAPIAQQDYTDQFSQIGEEEYLDMIAKIKSMQEMGMSNATKHYSEEELSDLPAVKLKSIYKQVTGNVSENMDVDQDVEIDESTLSRLIGKQKGGQALVRWLHREHKLSNEAELEPVPFDKQILNSQFKSHPDDFIIVSADNGVAGIKPDEKHINLRRAAAQKAGKTYNPGSDNTLPYHIIAFTDDGERVDPRLLKPEEKSEREKTGLRMGKLRGADLQNPNNVFALLQNQIGRLRTVWISGWRGYRGEEDSIKPAVGSVERDKLDKRVGYKEPADFSKVVKVGAPGKPGVFDPEAKPSKWELAKSKNDDDDMQLESISDLAKMMLEDVTIGHIVRQFKPAEQHGGEESPLTYGEENLKETSVQSEEELFDLYKNGEISRDELIQELESFANTDRSMRQGEMGMQGNDTPQGNRAWARDEQDWNDLDNEYDEYDEYDELAEVEDDSMMQDDGLDAGADLSMGAIGGTAGGGTYAPGTAPTMPESINQGNIMENVDKDVAAMLNSLKKYDTLLEGKKEETTWTDSKGNKHPATKVTGDKYTGKEAEKESKKKDSKKDDLEEATEKKETTWTDSKGNKHPATQVKGDKYTGKEAEKESKSKKDLEEAADPEVLEWMSRFAKLGNMKGYGR